MLTQSDVNAAILKFIWLHCCAFEPDFAALAVFQILILHLDIIIHYDQSLSIVFAFEYI